MEQLRRSIRLSVILITIGGLVGVMPFINPVYALNVNFPPVTKGDRPMFDIRYRNGLIGARIQNVPLGQVVRALAVKTGMEIRLVDPLLANWPVMASVEGMPVADAMKRILEGFSYVFYPAANGPVAIVLSTSPVADKSGMNVPVATRHGIARTPPQDANSEKTPRSLDEFQSIAADETLAFSQANDKKELSHEEQALVVHEQLDAILRRALDALSSDYRQLHAEAITQLAGIDDPLATEALVEAARTGVEGISRVHVVEALWQHAAILKFAEPTSVSILNQLSEDSDISVRKIARRALKDMQQYLQITARKSD